MMKKNNFLFAAILILGSVLLSACSHSSETPVTSQMPAMPDETGNHTEVTEMVVEDTSSMEPSENEDGYVVRYTNEGYVPSTMTIEAGETITFKNESRRAMWTASAMHPTHAVYDGTNLSEHCDNKNETTFDECESSQPGEEWSFTFTKTGTWKYHNHVNPVHSGAIVVE